MKEQGEHFNPEEIDKQTERSYRHLARKERHLVRGLYTLSLDYNEEKERALERVWYRLVQEQRFSSGLLQYSKKAPEGKVLSMKGREIPTNDTYWGTEGSTFSSHRSKKSEKSSYRSFKRLLGTGIVAAAVLTLVVSWALVFSGAHTGLGASSTRVGSSHVQTTSQSEPLCSFTAPGPKHLDYDTIHSLSWASNSAITTTSGSLVTYDVNTCKQQASPTSMQAQAAFWSPDGTRLLLLSYSGQIAILDAQGNVLVKHSAKLVSSATSLTTGFTPLASLSGGSNNNVLEIAAWSPDGTRVASIFELNTVSRNQSGVEIWDAKTGAHQIALLCPDDQGRTNKLDPVIAWSSDGTYLLGAGLGGNRTCVWSTRTGQLIASIPIRTGIVDSFSPDSKFVTLTNENNSVEIYDLATKQITQTFAVKDSSPFSPSVAWSPDGTFLAIVGQDLHILRASDGAEIASYALPRDTLVEALAWAPESTMIATVSSKPGIKHIDANGKTVINPGSPDGFVTIWRVK